MKKEAIYHKAIDNAAEYVKSNLNSDLSLGAVAAYVGFSAVHLHNVF